MAIGVITRRGARVNKPVEFLSGINLTNQTSDGARSLTLSTGFDVGDMLLVMIGNRTATPPTLLSGYTNILTNSLNDGTNSRSYRVQYKIATSSSETINWTGAYGYIIAFRNASTIGQTNTITTGSIGNIQKLPSLSNLDTSGRGFIIGGNFYTSLAAASNIPYFISPPFGFQIPNNTFASIPETDFSVPSVAPITYAIELL